MSRIAESSPNSGTRSKLKVRVFENDHRVLSAKLEDDRCHIWRSGSQDPFPGCDRSSEHDLVGSRVDKRRSGFAPTGNDLDNVSWEACFFEDLTDLQADKRREFRWLDHNGISCHQRHNGFAKRDRKRIVPCGDDADDTERVIYDL